MAESFYRLGVTAQVSLDAPVPDIHDYFRQVPGAWKRCLMGIHRLLKARVNVTLAATVTTLNIDMIPALYDFAANLEVATFRILPFVPGGRGSLFKDLEVSPDRMMELTLLLHQRHEEVGLPVAPMEFECTLSPPPPPSSPRDLHVGCDGAIAYCTISSYGDVLPCNFFAGMEADNVRHHSFEWIWRNSAILNYFRSLVVNDIHGQCRNCDWLSVCRGSCLAANFVHGDIFQSNYHCWLIKGKFQKLRCADSKDSSRFGLNLNIR
jgi:radical SAM protein with 4Fe4S-binding SPASM domain